MPRCAPLPEVARSAPMPLMKWSTPLPMGSSGMRDLAVQCTPSVELLKTMSLAEQLLSKLQSGQEIYTRPPPSMVLEGSPALRRSPSSPWLGACAIWIAAVQLWPPLVEVNADMPPLKSAKGTTTV